MTSEDDHLEAAYEDANGAPEGDEQDDHDYPDDKEAYWDSISKQPRGHA